MKGYWCPLCQQICIGGMVSTESRLKFPAVEKKQCAFADQGLVDSAQKNDVPEGWDNFCRISAVLAKIR